MLGRTSRKYNLLVAATPRDVTIDSYYEIVDNNTYLKINYKLLDYYSDRQANDPMQFLEHISIIFTN